MAVAIEERVSLSAGSAGAAESRAPSRWLGSYSPPAPPRGARATSFLIVRLAAAFILLIAASLKLHAWLVGDAAPSSLGDPHWQLALILGEFALAAWLLSGRAKVGSWAATVLCFSAFAGVSIAKALAGAPSCGCFGSFDVSPWVTGAIDVAVVAALCLWRPGQAVVGTRSRPALATWVIVAAPLVMASAAKLAEVVDAPAVLNDDGTITGNGRTVSVETDRWVGRRLPLLPHIDVGSRLAGGRCVVLFYDADCAVCKEALSALSAPGDYAWTAGFDVPDLALVDASRRLREKGTAPLVSRIWCAKPTIDGHLDASRRWLIETPLLVELRGGVVVCTKSGKAVLGEIEEGLPPCGGSEAL
ncbi:MAG: hypothetical protein HYS13_16515 [Planctomycetia bacterium]|nr:hypothetical protein [Planctomycetia bacterium]